MGVWVCINDGYLGGHVYLGMGAWGRVVMVNWAWVW